MNKLEYRALNHHDCVMYRNNNQQPMAAQLKAAIGYIIKMRRTRSCINKLTTVARYVSELIG